MKNLQTFKHAITGITHVFKKEQNFRIHSIAAILVIIAGIIFSIDKTEWLIIIIAITSVITLELLNSAIEYVCNFISPEYHEKIKIIKDASAGAVLIAAIGAFIIGLVIFLTKIILLF